LTNIAEPSAADRVFAVIAGSGFKALAGDAEGQVVDTPFGQPSSPIRDIAFGDTTALLVSRHGDDLLIPPHAINYRANMKALAQLGVTDIVALNTVGVITADIHPGEIAVPDQIIDYTFGRDHSIYGADSDTLDFIEFTEPLNRDIRRDLLTAAKAADVQCHDGGVYGAMQGPRLESTAEVNRLERDGVDYVGMTVMPEASLAMELGMRYGCLSLIVNYAAGRSQKGIHEDIEESTLTAKMQSMKILKEYFRVVA
jgi:5'-methylthioinosine phosphorylase